MLAQTEKKRYVAKRVTSASDPTKTYYLFIQENGMAVHCTCPSRKFRKGKACKHMQTHNKQNTAANEKLHEKVAEHLRNENQYAYEQLAPSKCEELRQLHEDQLAWAQHWSPLLNVSVEALLEMGAGEYRPLIEAYEQERNDYNRVALALGW